MNRLRRMVLVNSANVPYREVELDGHIHFIGTQGTGKSTLLRALLFFYNADSRKLGISAEKKSFAEYYFPYADSYIFYEVQAGARCFCVWLYKRARGLCFRFVDGGYARELVLDGTSVRSEEEVLAKAGELNAKVERAIHNFKDYRDILYGENRSMRRYALMQGVANYATIPRTISNIFLNANLDGGYIKRTMIDSLSDEAVEINLEANRHHLDTARSHYADVSEYLRNEAQAKQIVSVYEAVLELEERQRSTAWQVGAACNWARETARGLGRRMVEKADEEAAQRSLLRELQEKYDTEKRRLGDQLAVVKKHIAHSNERKRFYAEQGIDALLKAAAARPQLEQELSLCREQRQVLTARAEQQEAQFQIALQKMENECNRQIQQLQAELSDAKDRNRESQDEVWRHFELEKGEQSADFEEGCAGFRRELTQAERELHELEVELRRLDEAPLFAEERDRLKQQGQELVRRKICAEGEQQRNSETVAALQREAEDQQKLARHEGENRLRPLSDTRETLKQTLAEQKAELASLSGSLLEFLDEAVEGWQATIGKTVRRDVLLRSGLEPVQTEGRSLFGIELKLEHLESEALSKSALEAALADTEQQLKTQAKEIEKLLDENRATEDRLLQKYNRKVQALRELGKKVSVELFSVERDLERNDIAERELAEKMAAQRAALQADVDAKIHGIRTRIRELEKLIADRTAVHETAQKRVEADLNRRLKQLCSERADHEKRCADGMSDLERQMETQRERLQQDRRAALEQAGVNAKQVTALDEQIRQCEQRLETIRQGETLRIEYAKDKREWMDRLPEFRSSRAQLEQKLAHQAELFERRFGAEQARHREIAEELNGLKQEQRQIAEEVAAFEAFEKEELFAMFESFISHHDLGEAPDCRERISSLKDLSWKFEKQFKQLTERVTAFSGFFSEGNCLGFEVHLSGEAAFRTFAEEVSAFVCEQKIVPLKTEVTKKYSMVLNAIVTETNRLLQREGEVQRLITKINSDFRASNFVGVVHSIEMRVQESSNRIFQVLREICRFQAENHMNFGEIDLFNRGDSGSEEQAVELLDQLRDQMSQTKSSTLRLEDALDLEFRVCENENDTNWVSRLANVGSNGTDVLVKSMIYINLLNIFKESGRKQTEAAQLHCLVDEVGILHDSNVKSLIQFAAERGICMINGSPNSHNEQDYRHIYMFRKENNKTAITKLISHAN